MQEDGKKTEESRGRHPYPRRHPRSPENDLGTMNRMRAELALPSLLLWPTRSDEPEEHVLRRMEALQKAKKQEMRRKICFEKALKNQLDD